MVLIQMSFLRERDFFFEKRGKYIKVDDFDFDCLNVTKSNLMPIVGYFGVYDDLT